MFGFITERDLRVSELERDLRIANRSIELLEQRINADRIIEKIDALTRDVRKLEKSK